MSRERKGRYKKKGPELGETVLGGVEMKKDNERSIRVHTQEEHIDPCDSGKSGHWTGFEGLAQLFAFD